MLNDNLKWKEVYNAATTPGRNLPGWHPELFHWVMAAVDDVHDHYADQKIDPYTVPEAEIHPLYFSHLEGFLCSGCFMDKETTAIAEKFFKSLGVEW